MTEKKYTDAEMIRIIREGIQRIAGTFGKDIVGIMLCNVDSIVNAESENTIDVTPINDVSSAQIPGVKISTEQNDGFIIVPKIDSTVMVAYSTINNYYVFSFSDIEKIIIKGGNYGGLIIGSVLKSQVDAISQSIKNACTAAFTAQSGFDAGAGINAFNASISSMPSIDLNTLLNKDITHGSS